MAMVVIASLSDPWFYICPRHDSLALIASIAHYLR
jgi:hypothetical protein